MRARWRRELDWQETEAARPRARSDRRGSPEGSPSQGQDIEEPMKNLCGHPREVMSDLKHSDSDTVFITYWCPDCRDHRTEEVIGSLARAMAEDQEESEREINPEQDASMDRYLARGRKAS